MAKQTTDSKQKNRRSRNAKISEYKLKKLVTCFAKDMTVKDTIAATKLSEPTVRDYFMDIRRRIHDHGFMPPIKRSGDNKMPARIVFQKKHRGVPEKYAHHYEAEFLHRVFTSRNLKTVHKFAASDEAELKKVQKFIRYNKLEDKYNIIEMLKPAESGKAAKKREFDPVDYERTSTILINERKVDPHEAFFRFIWALLLKYPL